MISQRSVNERVAGGGNLKKLTVRATKGTFRFISGKCSPSSYTIITHSFEDLPRDGRRVADIWF
jgi:hypothetical protein